MPTLRLKSHSDRIRQASPVKRSDKTAASIHGSARWTRLSQQVRRERPLCQRCEEAGLISISTEVHHIIKAGDAPGRAYDTSNLRALCHPCHVEEEKELNKRNQ